MYLARGGMGDVGVSGLRGLGLAFSNPVESRGVWGLCLCIWECGWVARDRVRVLEVGVVLCMCML